MRRVVQSQNVRVQKQNKMDQEIPKTQHVTELAVWHERKHEEEERKRYYRHVHEHVENSLVPGVIKTAVHIIINPASFREPTNKQRQRERERERERERVTSSSVSQPL